MAKKLIFALGAGYALAACDNGSCNVDDDMALHQHALRLRSISMEEAPLPTEAPTKKQVAAVRPKIHEIIENAYKRVSTKANLPVIPAVFRWELVGKATDFIVNRYKKPRTAPARELLEGLLDITDDVVGAKDFMTLEDAEVNIRLNNLTRLHKLVRDFATGSGAPPAVTKLVDAAYGAAETQGSLDAASTSKILLDVANETGGPAVADLVKYANDVSSGKEQLDMAHAAELYIPVFNHFGAPPALEKFLKETVENIRNKVERSPQQESARGQKMLAESARELGLPSAISEALDYMAGLTERKPEELLAPEEGAKILVHLQGLLAKVIDQIGGPAALSELIRHLVAPLQNQTALTPVEGLGLLGKASRQLNFPGAVGDFFDYMVEIAGKSASPDPEKVHDLFVELSQQAGAPEPLAKFSKDLAALPKKDNGSPDPAKVQKLVAGLLKKLGMPEFSELFAKIVGPMILKGKQPDPLTMAAVAPGLTKVFTDMDTAQGIVHDMRKKLCAPLMAFYEQAVEKITGQMPDSVLKTAFRAVLSIAKPPA